MLLYTIVGREVSNWYLTKYFLSTRSTFAPQAHGIVVPRDELLVVFSFLWFGMQSFIIECYSTLHVHLPTKFEL